MKKINSNQQTKFVAKAENNFLNSNQVQSSKGNNASLIDFSENNETVGNKFISNNGTNSINGFWYYIGSLGLFTIGMGLTQLPKKISFEIMTIGGFLIVLYSGPWALKIWIWFILNMIFFAANILTLLRWKEK